MKYHEGEIMIKNVVGSFLLLSLVGCSSSRTDRWALPIDSIAVNSFAHRIGQRFTNYAEASGYQTPAQRNPGLDAIPTGNELIYKANPSEQVVVMMYTFDRSDSCILYAGVKEDAIYDVLSTSLPLPAGRYLLKLGGTVDSFHVPSLRCSGRLRAVQNDQ